MGSFVSIPIEADPEALAQAAMDEIAAEFPGWEAPPGAFENRFLRAAARMTTDLLGMAADVPAEVFFKYGEKILQIPPQAAVAAAGETTWTMIDAAGYTIKADTQVLIPVAGDDLAGFRVVSEVQVPVGETTTETGEVVLQAIVPGAEANDLDGTPRLFSSDRFVDSIVLEDPTHGGLDAQTADEYNDALVDETKLLAPRPILPEDAAILARRIPNVYRCLALDGYNPADETTDNERMVALFPIAEDGEENSVDEQAAVSDLLEAMREINFLFPVASAEYTLIDVDYAGFALPGFDPAVVKTAVDAALSSYLSPANFGRYPTDRDLRTWRDIRVIRHSELVTVVNNVPGFDFVDSDDLTLAIGGDALSTANVTLVGPGAVLPRPGDITGTVT